MAPIFLDVTSMTLLFKDTGDFRYTNGPRWLNKPDVALRLHTAFAQKKLRERKHDGDEKETKQSQQLFDVG